MKRLALTLLLGCATTSEPAAITPPKVSLRSATALLRPVPHAEGLLGRAVEQRPDGKWTIADERVPGCTVETKRTPVDIHEHNRSYVRGVAALQADYLNVAKLSAHATEIRQVDFDVHQSEVLEAELVGPCGAQVITSVYIGQGRQGFLGSRERTVGASVGVEGVGATAGAEVKLELVDTIAWKTAMAYAFEHRTFAAAQALRITTNLPSHLDEGRPLELAFTSSRAAYLVVFGVDAEGVHSLLWPSNEEPMPLASADTPLNFPSAAERAAGYSYRLHLPAGTITSVREALLVYAFRELGDFEAVHPSRLGSDARYAEKLRAQLTSIPPSRWSRYEFSYELRSAGPRAPSFTLAPTRQ